MKFDLTFPTDNAWGVPLLDASMQAVALPSPFAAWGSVARSSYMPGTYHFYIDDYKFSALWTHPERIIDCRCTAVVEPNFSTNEQTPMARVLWDVFRKRWIARYWQQHGVRVLVDLNVSDRAAEINLLGVPRGWTAYATRFGSEGLSPIHAQAERAKAHADGKPLTFVVYSGGKAVEEECQRNGWIHVANTAGRAPHGNATAATA